MAHIIEESLDINVNHIMQMTPLHIFMNLSDCVSLASVRSESVAVVMEFGFTYWLQDLQDTLLNKSVYNGWYT